MASNDPEDMFSSCKVCKKRTTKSTIMKHMSISKDDKHVKFKKSEDYRNLENAIKKANKLKKQENNMQYYKKAGHQQYMSQKEERRQQYLSQREERHQQYMSQREERRQKYLSQREEMP